MPLPFFAPMKRRFLLGTFGINVLVLALCYAQPWVGSLAAGMALGWVNLILLIRSAEKPREKAQAGMSVVRMMGLGYLIVLAGQGNTFETSVVIAGFLSYKLILLWEILHKGVFPSLIRLIKRTGSGSFLER
jgi:hypothetical protein